jgi:HEAT repeat protein
MITIAGISSAEAKIMEGFMRRLLHFAAFVLVTLAAAFVFAGLAWQFAAVRESVMEAAPHFGALAVPLFRDGLEDEDAGVRKCAAAALRQLGPDAVPGLIASLDDDRPQVRRTAARALGVVIGAREAIPMLIVMVQREPDTSARLAAVQALELIGPDASEGVPAVLDALASSDAEMRVAAAVCLGTIGQGNDAAVAGLAAARDDANPRVREFAAESPTRLGR